MFSTSNTMQLLKQLSAIRVEQLKRGRFRIPPQKNLLHAQVCAFCDSANCRFRHLSLMDRKTFYALLLIQLHISLFFFCWSCLHNSISHLENHEICNQNTHYSELMLNDLNEIEQPNQVGIMNKKVPNTIGGTSKVIKREVGKIFCELPFPHVSIQ